jgi:hypothetical protein
MSALDREIARQDQERARVVAYGYASGRMDSDQNPLLDCEDSSVFAAEFAATGQSWGALRREYDAWATALVAERDAAQQAYEVAS